MFENLGRHGAELMALDLRMPKTDVMRLARRRMATTRTLRNALIPKQRTPARDIARSTPAREPLRPAGSGTQSLEARA